VGTSVAFIRVPYIQISQKQLTLLPSKVKMEVMTMDERTDDIHAQELYL
jgi:hypothetical protein